MQKSGGAVPFGARSRQFLFHSKQPEKADVVDPKKDEQGDQRHQHPDQDGQFFLSIHTFFLLRNTSSTPSSRKPTGMMPIMQTLSQAADEELMVR